MNDRHHVVRIDIEPDQDNPDRGETHGWQVRVSFRGRRRTKFFADRKYGSGEDALTAAKQYRDELLRQREQEYAEGPVERRAQSRSLSGVAGIRLAYKNDVPYIEANWVVDGARSVSSFSVDRWGLRKAVWQACKARAAGRGYRDPKRVQGMFDRAFPTLRDHMNGHEGDGRASTETPEVQAGAVDQATRP